MHNLVIVMQSIPTLTVSVKAADIHLLKKLHQLPVFGMQPSHRQSISDETMQKISIIVWFVVMNTR